MDFPLPRNGNPVVVVVVVLLWSSCNVSPAGVFEVVSISFSFFPLAPPIE